MRRRLREWRKRGSGEWEYKEKKREYERMCKRKKREEEERWLKKAKEARTEGQV